MERWDEDIIPKLIDYIRIPNKSPHFDPDWAEQNPEKVGVAELIIGGTLLVILQDVVRLADFLELTLSVRIPGVAVRVILHRQLAIGALNDLGRRLAVDAQHFVVVSFGHCRSY